MNAVHYSVDSDWPKLPDLGAEDVSCLCVLIGKLPVPLNFFCDWLLSFRFPVDVGACLQRKVSPDKHAGCGHVTTHGPQPTQHPHAQESDASTITNLQLWPWRPNGRMCAGEMPTFLGSKTGCVADSSPATHQTLQQQGGTGEDSYIHPAVWTFSEGVIEKMKKTRQAFSDLLCRVDGVPGGIQPLPQCSAVHPLHHRGVQDYPG